MSNISSETIEKLALLARIKVTSKEKEHFSREISTILNYVENLNKLEIKTDQEILQTSGLKNVYRPDEVLGKSKTDKDTIKNRENILVNAPAKQDEYFKVKAILE